MIFLPIVVRELRVAARRKSVYRARFWTAFAAIAFGSYLSIVCLSDLRMGAGGVGGAMVFNSLASIGFVVCLMLAANTADCISEEKREGTLGFLFLTDLKGYDIALGKLFSRSLYSLYSLLGTFPIVAVSLLLGGVSARELWQMALALLNVFFFSQTASLLVSALGRKRNSVNFAAASLLLGYSIGLPLLEFGLRAAWWGNWVSVLGWLNPAYCGFLAFGTQSTHYWTSLMLVHLNAWLFLAVASWWLPRCWQEKPKETKFRWRDRFLRWYHNRNTPRQLLLDNNPFLWLTIRNRLGSIKVWIALLLVNGFWGWLLYRNRLPDADMAIFAGAIISNHLAFKLIVATEACGNLEEQRHSGALEFLLSCSPLTVREIIEGQWLALRRQLLRPMIAVLATDFAMMLVVLLRAMPHHSQEAKSEFALFVMAVVVMLVADTITLIWVGMWNGMSQKKARHAAGATLFHVLCVPWIFMILLQSLSVFSRSLIINSFGAAVGLWFAFGIGVDIIAASLTRGRLLAEFRTLAAAPIGEELGLFGHLGRWIGHLARPKAFLSAQ